MRYWINEVKGDDKLVVWDGIKLYKSNPKENQLQDFKYLLKKEKIPEGFFSIYKKQIKRIEMDESKKYISVYFGVDSYEHIKITNDKTKNEIFDELSQTSDSEVSVKELTISEKTKAQKKAFIVLTILFAIGFLFSITIENGTLPNGHYPTILLFLGSLGMINIVLFYLAIVLIIGIKFYLERKKNRIIHTIIFK